MRDFPPTTWAEVADRLDRLAEKVIQLPGVSRTRPHAFAEAKSDLRDEVRRFARELRGDKAVPPDVSVIPVGKRFIGSRRIEVVSKTRRA